MASVIKAGNATDGVQVTSDNTGILELKTGTGAGTTAMTIGTDQSVTFAAGTSINGITVGRGGGSVATNTAVGASALNANTTGSGNTAVGSNALDANTTGVVNTAVGGEALGANTTGSQNTAVGEGALQSNTTASFNTAVGRDAMEANTTGANNTALGWQALLSNTTASNNTALGYQAGYSQTTAGGGFNTFVGQGAGYTTNGFQNTHVGRLAGTLSTGNNNTFIGTDAGGSMTTGGKNTILGRYDGNQNSLDIRTLSNYIVLSDGDGNAKGVYDDKGGSTFVSTTIGSITGGGAAANLCSTGSIWRTNNTLQSAIVLVTASGSNGIDAGWSGAWILHCYKSFGTYAVTVMSSNLYLGSSGYSFTFSLDASNLKVSAGKTTGFIYVVERLGANGTA